MFSIEQATYYCELVNVVLAVTMLGCLGMLFIRCKWFNTPYHRNQELIKTWVKIGEFNAKVLLMAFIPWLILTLIQVPA